MELSILVNGLMAREMGLEFNNGLIPQNMRVNGKTTKHVEKERCSTQMGTHTMGNG